LAAISCAGDVFYHSGHIREMFKQLDIELFREDDMLEPLLALKIRYFHVDRALEARLILMQFHKDPSFVGVPKATFESALSYIRPKKKPSKEGYPPTKLVRGGRLIINTSPLFAGETTSQ
jgi:hypothetical protein